MLPPKKKQNQSPKKKPKQEAETKINYLEIIKRALNITFKNKFLWIFGIFIALTSGGSGGGNFGGNFGGGNTEEYFKGWKEKLGIGSGEEIIQIVKNFLESHWIIIVSIGIIFFLFAIALNVFAIISRGAIINGINKLDSKIKTGFKDSFKVGVNKFWRLLGISFTIGGLALIITTVIAAPIIFFFLTKIYIVAGILLILGILLFLFIIILLSLISRFAFLFTVCTNQGVFSSLGSAYGLLTKKTSKIIIAWLIGIALNLLIGMATFLILLPFIIIGVLMAGTSLVIFHVIGLIASIMTMVFLLIILGSFLKGVALVFVQSFWVLFFKEIAGEKIKNKKLKTKIKEKIPAKIIAG